MHLRQAKRAFENIAYLRNLKLDWIIQKFTTHDLTQTW